MLPRPRRDLLAVGLMSGTSVDAVDVAVVRIHADTARPLMSLVDYAEFPFGDELRGRVRRAMRPESSSVDSLCVLNRELAESFAAAAQQTLARHSPPLPIDFIASHGQTVYHAPRVDPARGWTLPSTLQLGDGSTIAARLRVPCVCDFRTADVAAGGTGAPLIPFVDAALLSRPDRPVVCQNIGGIANCTILPPPALVPSPPIVAFDQGPGNMVMDLALSAWGAAERFDEGGRLAAGGTAIEPLLAELLAHPYFAAPLPKSTGHETFGASFVDGLLRRARELRPALRLEDVLATAAELTARCIVDGIRRFVPAEWGGTQVEVVVSGGGARNGYLMSRLRALGTPDLSFVTSAERGVPPDAKEALGFALLGYATLCGVPANVPSVTGAATPAVLGKICPVGSLRELLAVAGAP